MQRAIIIAKGRVQKVGYRDFVAEIANSLNIGGRAKNLPDGTVRIIAEAEKDVIEQFIPLIQPKDDPMIKVTGVDVRFEKPTVEFEYFDVEYEDFDKEGFERIGIAAVYLKQLNKGQGKMLDKQDQTIEIIKDGNKKLLDKQDKMLDKQDKTIQEIRSVGEKVDAVGEKVDAVGEKVDSLREETRQDFNRMDVKYDKVSNKLDKIDEKLNSLDNIDKTLNRLVDVLSSK